MSSNTENTSSTSVNADGAAIPKKSSVRRCPSGHRVGDWDLVCLECGAAIPKSGLPPAGGTMAETRGFWAALAELLGSLFDAFTRH